MGTPDKLNDTQFNYNAMKTLLLLFCSAALSITFNSCSGPAKVTQKTISQKYYDLNFTPETLTKKIVNNTEITITPIDARSLNKEMFEASNRDGNYDKEINSILETFNERLSRASKQQKIYLQGKINAFEYLSAQEKEGKIPANIALLLKRKINDERSGNDGSEPETLGDGNVFTNDSYNPYKSQDKYFSVFRIAFENKGSEIEKINLKEFQLISNDEQLYPLSSGYFETILRSNTETIKNAYRKNMPDELVITSGQKITKYLAVPAINSENSKLQVQFIRDKNVVDFDFDLNRKEVDKKYTLENYTLDYTGEGNEFAYKVFYVISYKDNVSFAIENDKLFVSNDKKQLPASIYAIGINTSNSEIVYAATENFKFASVSGNKKQVEFRKVRKK